MKQLVKILLVMMLVVPLGGIFIASCSEDDYCATSRPMFICDVKKYYSSTNDSLVADTLESLHITAAVTDSVIFNNGTNVTQFSIPLQYTVDTTALVFHYADGKPDTVVFKHTNTPYFISMECGFEMKQVLSDVSYSRHKVRTIEIRKTAITNDGSANLQFIYNN